MDRRDRTDDDRGTGMGDVETHRVIKGRRWRVSDPRIPEDLRQALVDALMAARRAVRDAADDEARRRARRQVHDAKVALGERGVQWWSDMADPTGVDDRIRRAHRVMTRISDLDAGSVVSSVAAITSQTQALVTDVIAEVTREELGDDCGGDTSVERHTPTGPDGPRS